MFFSYSHMVQGHCTPSPFYPKTLFMWSLIKARQGGESKYALKKICVVWYDLDPGVDL